MIEKSSLSTNTNLYNLHKKINDRVYCSQLCNDKIKKIFFKPFNPIKPDDLCLNDYLMKKNNQKK